MYLTALKKLPVTLYACINNRMEVRSRALFGAAGEDGFDYAEHVKVLAIAAHQV